MGLVALAAVLIFAMRLSPSAAADAAHPPVSPEARPRLAVLDWTLLETLVAMGQPPVAAADLGGYATWVGETPLPDSIVDIGMRNQPNLELMSQLRLDQVLLPPLFASLTPLLSRIAPVQSLPLYTGDRPLWQRLRDFTRELASYTADPGAAEPLIARVESRLATIAQALPKDMPALLIVQFSDDRHVRVFGEHSLYSAVLERLGIRTAWKGQTNAWGFSLVGIEALAEPENLVAGDIRVGVVKPVPPGAKAAMAGPGLWQSLPAVARGDVLTLAPAWSFGGLPSALRFAELLYRGIVDVND